MKEVVINGIIIRFPFDPYSVQTAYMEKLIECLQKGVNGILESPTGTGKTLCLLCASLAWLETKKAEVSLQHKQIGHESNPFSANLSSQLKNSVGTLWTSKRAPQIIYASRTHSQLHQVISELKRTSYSYMKAAIIGSRDQLCIHPEVSAEFLSSSKIHSCQIRVKARSCFFHTQVESKKENPDLKSRIMDIEDLVKAGKKQIFCPYYMSREFSKDADIIFMPYNYLLDPKTRRTHNIELEGTIVIFDEAHNIEKICEDSASLQLRSSELALCVDEVTQLMEKICKEAEASEVGANDPLLCSDFNLEEVCCLKKMFLALEEGLDELKLPDNGELVLSGEYMFEYLAKGGINAMAKNHLVEVIENIILYFTANATSPFHRKGAGLQKFVDILHIVFSKSGFSLQHVQYVKQCYKVYITVEQPQKKKQEGWGATKQTTLDSKPAKVLSFWCFSPGFGMKDLLQLGVKSIILTSGTLSPLESFTAELQIPFPVQLINQHIIQDYQVFVGVVTKGPDTITLNSSFKNRSNEDYIKSLGITINNLSKIFVGGLLIFFSSYPVMKSCQEIWQKCSIWDSLSKAKPIFIEPNTKSDFLTAMNEFYNKIDDTDYKGACFMAVCRGKVSEGLDFADNNGRAVVITGLPYPPFKDPRVILKKLYLQEIHRNSKKGLTGQEWYKLEASRAVNQAIGRVIRHKDDYGAIILCDERFGQSGFSSQLSPWVRNHLKIYTSFGPVVRDLTSFFRTAKLLLPPPKSKVRTSEKEESNERIKYEPQIRPVSSSAFAPAFSRILTLDKTGEDNGEHATNDFDLREALGKKYLKRKACHKKAVNEDLFAALDNHISMPISFTDHSLSTSGIDTFTVGSNKKKKKIIVIPNADTSFRDFSANMNAEENLKADYNAGIKPEIKNELAVADKSSYASDNSLTRTVNTEKMFEKCDTEAGAQLKNCNSEPESTLSSQEILPCGQKNNCDKKDNNTQIKNEIQEYLKKVKKNLTSDEYSMFMNGVKSYQKLGNYDELLQVLCNLFLTGTERHNFMKG